MKTKAHLGLIVGITAMAIVLGCSLAWGYSQTSRKLSTVIAKEESLSRPELVKLRWSQEHGQELPEIVINGDVVLRIRSAAGGYTPWQRGELVMARLKEALKTEANISGIMPGFENGEVVIRAGPKLLVTVDRGSAQANKTPEPYLALAWANNIRSSLGVNPLEQEEAWQTLSRGRSVTARASWYGPRFHGRPTASGEIYDQDVYTAAHRTLPFGTLVLVRNLSTNKSVLVRINDRGPFIEGRSIDLSRAAARAIGMEQSGVADIQMSIIGP